MFHMQAPSYTPSSVTNSFIERESHAMFPEIL